jgi:hypothetical protein
MSSVKNGVFYPFHDVLKSKSIWHGRCSISFRKVEHLPAEADEATLKKEVGRLGVAYETD